MTTILNFIFPPPSSLFVTAMSAVSVISLANAGFSEVMGKHLSYSKFWNANLPSDKKGRSVTTVSSRAGMLFLYTPAALAAAASFFVPGVVVGARAQMLGSALALHYFKRVFEDIFPPVLIGRFHWWPKQFVHVRDECYVLMSYKWSLRISCALRVALCSFMLYQLIYLFATLLREMNPEEFSNLILKFIITTINMSALSNFIFPSPPLIVTAMSIISIISLSYFGLSEVIGRHLNYSKFWNINNLQPSDNKGWRGTTVSSRAGMLFLYAPAMAAAGASFLVPGIVVGVRAQMLSSALLLHFFKRVFEVLFIHQYSGRMPLDSAIPIFLSYTVSTVTMIYAQYLSQDMAEPATDLKYAGAVLFLIGIAGNFYHHHLLSKLRQKGDRAYKIPSGGLFGLVICPHYLFEIIGFYGVAFISQTVYAFSFAFGTTLYLIGRSMATRKWYLAKFENFPREIKALLPYIF